MTPGRECGPFLRIYRNRQTLLSGFFAGRSLESPYFRVLISRENGAAILKAGCSRIASFDGRILTIHGHLSDEYASDVHDMLMRDGLEIFRGEDGLRMAKMLPARWAYSWWSLIWDRSRAACALPYPFTIDILDLKLLLPRKFFADFCRSDRCAILQAQQESRREMMNRLRGYIVVPEDFRSRVEEKMLEMRLDEAIA